MANPYFIKSSLPETLAGISSDIRSERLRKGELAARERFQQSQLSLDQQRLDLERKQADRTALQQDRMHGIAQAGLQMKREAADREKNENIRKGNTPFTIADIEEIRGIALQADNSFFNQHGVKLDTAKAAEGIFNMIGRMSQRPGGQPGHPRKAILNTLMKTPNLKQPILDEITKKMHMVDGSDGVTPPNPEAHKMLKAQHERVSSPVFWANLMPQAYMALANDILEQRVKMAKIGGTPTNLGKLISERNALPDGDPNKAFYDQRIEKEIASTGESIEVDKDGNIRITRGPGAGMERKTRTDIQGKQFNAQEGIARLQEISSSYSPEFLQFDTKFNSLKSSLKEKFKGTKIPFTSIKIDDLVNMDVSDEDRQQLEAFSSFKRDSLSNINLYIKEITGAQMSEREAERIRKAMPDPGEGLFDGDAPTAFESKWKSTMKSLKASQARYIKYLKLGTMNDEQIQGLINDNIGMSLGNIEREINSYGDELKKQGLDNNAIMNAINEKYFKI